MTDYEELLQDAYDHGLIVIENFKFDSDASGVVIGKDIALSSRLKNDRERKCILAEEIAHSQLNSGDMVDLSNLSNGRQEIKAHKQAIMRLVPFNKLIDTIIELRDESNIYTLAQALDVTEDFLIEAIQIYSLKYGTRIDYGAYIVFFNPFRVAEKQKT